MDDIVIRPRYPRHSVPGRRRRKTPGDENTLAVKMTRQLLVSVLILVAAIGIKSINTPVTNFLSDKMKTVVVANIDLKIFYERLNTFFGTLKKDGKDDENMDIRDDGAIPVNAGVYGPEELNGRTGPEAPAQDGNGEIWDGTSSEMEEIRKEYRFIIPAYGIISSPFGERNDPFTKTLKLHKGIDIEAEKGSQVRAALEGTVIETGSSPTYGSYIKVGHSGGITTLYAHCSRITAKKEQEVKQGDTIAEVGNSGASVGSHLHFEVWKDKKVIDPLNFLDISLE